MAPSSPFRVDQDAFRERLGAGADIVGGSRAIVAVIDERLGFTEG